MLSIVTDIQSMNIRNNLTTATNAVDTALQRMSTGYKVNCAADDAAGLFLSSTMTAQLRGLKQAQKNTMDGLSYLNTAEGAINNMTDILNRIRDLSVQASNGIYSAESRAAMQAEADALVEQLFQIKNSTSFNGSSVFKIFEESPAAATASYTTTAAFSGAAFSRTLSSTAAPSSLNASLAKADFKAVSDSVSAITPPPNTVKTLSTQAFSPINTLTKAQQALLTLPQEKQKK